MKRPADDIVRIPFVLGVTGHRDLEKEDEEVIRRELMIKLVEVKQRFPSALFILISPLAEGADRIVAEVAEEVLGAKLFVPLPMESEEYKKDFTDQYSLQEYEKLLASAIKIVTLPLVEGSTPNDIRDPGVNRDKQYEQVGAFVAANCQVLIALWDGTEKDVTGSTSNVVKFKLKGVPDKYSHHSRLDQAQTGLVFHLLVRRASDINIAEDLYRFKRAVFYRRERRGWGER